VAGRTLTEVRGLDEVVELPAISISPAMSEIYDGIQLDGARRAAL
jgi:hypothetical protein